MSHQTTAWLVPSAASPNLPTKRPTDVPALPAWLTIGLLTLASGVLFALACASAWLSYHAQVAYVLAHNGNQTAEARVWALLLDAGTAGMSLMRLYETLSSQSGLATRASLLGCIAASVTMNLLHTPSRTAGGYLVAAVPPVMYAVFLEHLLTNLRSLLIAGEQQRTAWRTFVLWINFPALMWSGRRRSLRRCWGWASPASVRACICAVVRTLSCGIVITPGSVAGSVRMVAAGRMGCGMPASGSALAHAWVCSGVRSVSGSA